MDKLTITLLIILGGVLVVGTLLFFLAGVYRVKKNQVMIIEKAGAFYKECHEGHYFFMPIVYQRKGVYFKDVITRPITTINNNQLLLTYQIEDFQKYHYSGRDIEGTINKMHEEKGEMNEELLISTLAGIGVKYISIKAKEKD